MAVAQDRFDRARSRWARWLLAVLITTGILGVFRTGRADHACLTFWATTPITNPSGTACLGTPFTQPYTLQSCGTVPPLGVSHCETVSAHTP